MLPDGQSNGNCQAITFTSLGDGRVAFNPGSDVRKLGQAAGY